MRFKAEVAYFSVGEISMTIEYSTLTHKRKNEIVRFYKIRKISKMTIFRDELFGGSSDFNNKIWSEMESLSVLDVFCTDSECNTTLRSNFKKKSIL